MSEALPQTPALTPAHPARGAFAQTLAETLLVVGLAVVTFWKSLGVHFRAIDYDWLAIGKFGQEEFYSAIRQPYSSYRWLSGELFRWMYQVCGEDAFRYRLLLLTVHVVNSVLAGKLTARILGRPGSAWIAASIFAIAPPSSEAVHSIAAFVYPVVACLLITGLLFYDRAVKTGKVMPWALSMVCFGLAIPLREHALAAFPLAFLLEWLRGNGLKVFKTPGPWLRLLTPILAGLAFLMFRRGEWEITIPDSPDYQLTLSMGERLLVTLQRLVLPPVPLDFHSYAVVHKLIGLALLTAALVVILTAPRGDRRRGIVLLFALLISLAPFLPVEGDHIRQRFAYFGTVFAAGLTAFVISIAREKLSPRVALPMVLAILVGLLLEQQAEFERDYSSQSEESRARAESYRDAVQFVVSGDDIAIFVGDRSPSIVTARSTMRVVTGLQRRQLVLVKAKNSDELLVEVKRLRGLTEAKGRLRLYVRSASGYDRLRIAEFEDGLRRIFESEQETGERTIFAMLPRVPNSASR